MQRLVLALLCTVGCSNELPGQVVGTYLVTMKLEENTCGPNAVFLSDGRMYSAQLRADGATAYWRIADAKPLAGEYTDKGEFKFSFSSIVATSDPDAGGPVCQLLQTEVLSGKIQGSTIGNDGHDRPVDAGGNDGGPHDAGLDPGLAPDSGGSSDAPTTLSGTHELEISAAQGSDCRRAFPPHGPFTMLPCKVRYRLVGRERDEF